MTPEQTSPSEGTQQFENAQRNLLTGKNIFITGGSRDIGAGIVKALTGAGANVLSIHRDTRKSRRADQVLQAAAHTDGRLAFLIGDITRDDDRRSITQHVEENFDATLDVVILNASGPTREVNVVAANALVDQFLPLMRSGGKIVLMQSVPGHYFNELEKNDIPEFYSPIAQAKHEGEQSLRHRIPEFAKKGISFLVVCPPEVSDTANIRFFRRSHPDLSDQQEALSEKYGLPAVVTVEDVSKKMVELLTRDDLPQGYVEFFTR